MDVGGLTLFVKARGFIMGRAAIDNLEAGQNVKDLVIRLEPAIPIAGLVGEASGEPVGGAQLFLDNVRLDFVRTRPVEADAVTDRDGRFLLDSLTVELQWIVASHRNHAPAVASVSARRGVGNDIRIVLTSGGSVEGTFTMADDALGASSQKMSVRVR